MAAFTISLTVLGQTSTKTFTIPDGQVQSVVDYAKTKHGPDLPQNPTNNQALQAIFQDIATDLKNRVSGFKQVTAARAAVAATTPIDIT